MPLDGREIKDEAYRYGYQGQFSEKDITTGQQQFELRNYDARFGRWLSPDPYGQYASPYVAMGNNPIINVDPDGGFVGGPFGTAMIDLGLAAGPTSTIINGVVTSVLSEVTVTATSMALTHTFASMAASFGSGFIGGISSTLQGMASQGTLENIFLTAAAPGLKLINDQYQGTKGLYDLGAHIYNNWSSFTANDFAYGAGYSSEKIAEIYLLKKISSIHGVNVGRSIVIGEGMELRVKPAARSVGAKWYQAWSKNFPKNRLMTESELSAAKARNARWIKSKIKQGYKIYDIGPRGQTITSPFYQLERDIINAAQYPTTPLLGF